jgi:hypothetical protein
VARRFKHDLGIAKDEALKACDAYNQRPLQRNLETFLAHMPEAWLALFHALNERDGIDMRYRTNGRIERIDGVARTWDLPTCIERRIPNPADPVRLNLEFFLKLQRKIEHRYSAKAIDAIELLVAGKAQACIRDFENTLVSEFGTGESLASDLRFPVFLSSLTPDAHETLKSARAKAPRAIAAFIDGFDAGLDPAVAEDDRFEFRVLLFQKTGPKSDDDPAVEFLSVSDLTPEQRKAMETAMVLVRDKQVPVANLDRWRPGEVVKRVQTAVPQFSLAYHTYAYRHFNVRPRGRAPNPAATNPAYALFDAAHGDYVYTQAWVTKLLHELEADPDATLAVWKDEALAERRRSRAPAA